VDAALDLVPQMDGERAQVLGMAAQLRQGLRDLGSPVLPGQSHIVPILLGDADAALSASAFLLAQGFFCPAIRPPTVPEGGSRLRIALNPQLTPDVIRRLLEALAQLMQRI
jgi:8-amino-7-oxononanoate synthase